MRSLNPWTTREVPQTIIISFHPFFSFVYSLLHCQHKHLAVLTWYLTHSTSTKPLWHLPSTLCLSANCLSSLFWASPLCHHSVYEWLWLGPVLTLDSTLRGFSVWHSLCGSAFQCLSSRAPGGMSVMDGLHPPHPGAEGKKKVMGGVGYRGMKCEMAGIDLWVSRVSPSPL